jgi:hypothetical protein
VQIRKVCDEYGVSHETVKQKRNAFAHGDLPFVECGRDYTVVQLGEIKHDATIYLRAILRNIDKFTARKTYRV